MTYLHNLASWASFVGGFAGVVLLVFGAPFAGDGLKRPGLAAFFVVLGILLMLFCWPAFATLQPHFLDS